MLHQLVQLVLGRKASKVCQQQPLPLQHPWRSRTQHPLLHPLPGRRRRLLCLRRSPHCRLVKQHTRWKQRQYQLQQYRHQQQRHPLPRL